MKKFYEKDGTEINLLQDTDETLTYDNSTGNNFNIMKFPNGLMVITATALSIVPVANTVTTEEIKFPESFMMIPIVFINSTTDDSTAVQKFFGYAVDKTKYKVGILRTNTNESFYRLLAIGRWK